jgi:hypothetical protein
MTGEPEATAKLIPGAFVYTDRNGQLQAMYFQFNPEKLARSRSAQFQETQANDTQGTTTARGRQGKKYTLSVERWKIDLDIRLDASKSAFVSDKQITTNEFQSGENSAQAWFKHLEQVKLSTPQLTSVAEGLKHLEAMIEPGPIPSENDSTYGFQSLPDPPMVQFLWGDRLWAGFLTSLSISEVQFTPKLQPIRAEATVSLVIIETLRQLQQGKIGGKQ